MVVVHAERHTVASNFRLMTSVLPINKPPIVKNYTVQMKESSAPVTFDLSRSVSDIDLGDPSFVSLLHCVSGCELGSLASPGMNVWFRDTVQLTFTPDTGKWGTAVYAFNGYDGKDNSSSIAYLNIVIEPVNGTSVPIITPRE